MLMCVHVSEWRGPYVQVHEYRNVRYRCVVVDDVDLIVVFVVVVGMVVIVVVLIVVDGFVVVVVFIVLVVVARAVCQYMFVYELCYTCSIIVTYHICSVSNAAFSCYAFSASCSCVCLWYQFYIGHAVAIHSCFFFMGVASSSFLCTCQATSN